MGGGTDVALETADAAVLHGRVADVAAMVDLSKRTMSNIKQNITVALGLNPLARNIAVNNRAGSRPKPASTPRRPITRGGGGAASARPVK